MVSFENLTPALADLSGTQVTFTHIGVARIRATQAGNANWNPAPEVTHTFQVSGLYSLDIVSEQGTGTPQVGTYTNVIGTLLTNSVTLVETLGGTQYVNVGWTMTGNDPATGITNAMSMSHTNDAVLTWLWQTNYLFDASAGPGGGITGDTTGFYAARSSVTVTATAESGYVFTGWLVNGIALGSGNPLRVPIDEAKNVSASFTAGFDAVPAHVTWSVVWVFNPRLGVFTGTLTIENTSSNSLMAPFWFEVPRTTRSRLRFPTGTNADSDVDYLDITTAVTNQLPGIGNGDMALDPGETVTVTEIQLIGKHKPENVRLRAFGADPDATFTPPVIDDGEPGGDDNDLPTDVFTGSFDGYFYAAETFDSEQNTAVQGTLTLKISSTTGRLSAQAMLKGGRVRFRASAWSEVAVDGTCQVALSARSGEILDLFVRGERMWGTLQGGRAGTTVLELHGGRNRFADRGDATAAALLKEFRGYYTIALPTYAAESLGKADAAPLGVGYLAVTVGSRGSAKVAGVLADGTRVSRSSRLILAEGEERVACIPLFAPLYAQKGGIEGLLWLDPLTRTITTASDMDWFIRWEKPGRGSDGFHMLLDVCGGFYSSMSALATEYLLGAEADAAYWHREGMELPVEIPQGVPVVAVGNRFSVPRGSTPKKVVEADTVWFAYDETNPTQTKMRFTSRTGIFTGSFRLYYDFELGDRLQHKAVTSRYAGILTPVRDPDFADLPVGMGHCLIRETDPLFNALRLKRSYPVWLEEAE